MKKNKYLQFGKYTKDCPRSLLNNIDKIGKNRSENKYVKTILLAIHEEFNPAKYKITHTNDFKKSRFISVKNILNKRQASCGSKATVVASVLRSLGYPTKLINGLYIKDNPQMRHAWNEVLINNKWVIFDITRKDFKIGKYHIKKNEWIDWGDLKKIYH
jgi:transglutaminase/protease-like cytokinesis protein 3